MRALPSTADAIPNSFHGTFETRTPVFVDGKVPFDDVRVSFPEWGALKPKTPLGQLPLLEVGGVTYSQSMAIVRYLAKLGGLYPEDPLECLYTEMVSDTLSELYAAFIDISFVKKDDTKKAEKTTKLLEEMLPAKFGALTSMTKGDYFLGGKVTFADIQIFDLFENPLGKFIPGFSAAPHPELKTIANRVKANPEIAAYLPKNSS